MDNRDHSTERELRDRIRRHADAAYPPLPAPAASVRPAVLPPNSSTRRRLTMAAVAVTVIAGIVWTSQGDQSADLDTLAPPGLAQELADDDLPPPELSSTTLATSTEEVRWPLLVLASPNQREVYIYDSVADEIVAEFAPENPNQIGLDGATGSPDGRAALWAASTVTFFIDGAVSTVVVPIDGRPESGTFELRVEFVPGLPLVWIVQPGRCCDNSTPSRALVMNYETGETVASADGLRANLLPRGMTSAGELIGRYDEKGDTGTVVLTWTGSVIGSTEISGEPLAVGNDGVVLSRCEPVCELVWFALADESLTALGPLPEGARAQSLARPMLPGAFSSFPTRNADGNRLFVGVRVSDETHEDGSFVTAWVVDLDAMQLSDAGLAPETGTAFWDCAGERIAGATLTEIQRSPDGSHPGAVPQDQGLGILVGVAACP